MTSSRRHREQVGWGHLEAAHLLVPSSCMSPFVQNDTLSMVTNKPEVAHVGSCAFATPHEPPIQVGCRHLERHRSPAAGVLPAS
jgi:hypothetical protein